MAFIPSTTWELLIGNTWRLHCREIAYSKRSVCNILSLGEMWWFAQLVVLLQCWLFILCLFKWRRTASLVPLPSLHVPIFIPLLSTSKVWGAWTYLHLANSRIHCVLRAVQLVSNAVFLIFQNEILLWIYSFHCVCLVRDLPAGVNSATAGKCLWSTCNATLYASDSACSQQILALLTSEQQGSWQVRAVTKIRPVSIYLWWTWFLSFKGITSITTICP